MQRTYSVGAVCVQNTCSAHACKWRAVHTRCKRGAHAVHMRCTCGAPCLLPIGLERVGAKHELHELEPLREQPPQRVDAAVVRQLEPTNVLHLIGVRVRVSQPMSCTCSHVGW